MPPLQHNKFILALCAMLLSGGCTMLDEMQGRTSGNATGEATGAPVESTAMTPTADINWLLRYYRHVSTFPDNALNDEYQRAKKAFTAEKTAPNQWRLAMLLSIPSADFHDPGRAATLFKELANDKLEKDPVLNNTAFLMYVLLNEQSRSDIRSSSLAEQLAESQSVNKKLQDQLDALKAIEDTLYERNKMEATPKP